MKWFICFEKKNLVQTTLLAIDIYYVVDNNKSENVYSMLEYSPIPISFLPYFMHHWFCLLIIDTNLMFKNYFTTTYPV